MLVFLDCPSTPNHEVKMKSFCSYLYLLTLISITNISLTEATSFEISGGRQERCLTNEETQEVLSHQEDLKELIIHRIYCGLVTHQLKQIMSGSFQSLKKLTLDD